MTKPSAKSRRRWFQFSLRSLLGLVTLVVVLLVAWRSYVEPYRQQRGTIALIEKLNGRYTTVEAQKWVRRLTQSNIQNILLVDLADCDEASSYIDRIAELPRLDTLIVGGSAFNDEHLRRLQRVKTLRRLLLDSTRITRQELARLEVAIPNLAVCCTDRRAIQEISQKHWFTVTDLCPRNPQQWQDVDGSYFQIVKVAGVLSRGLNDDLTTLSRMFHVKTLTLYGDLRDSRLSCFEELTQLEQLHLSRVEIGDNDWAYLEHLTNLRELMLCDASVGDSAMASVAKLPRLEWLNLNGTKVGDAGLAHLKHLKTLRTLLLEDTRVTDEGMVHLNHLTSLERLSLANTAVGDRGFGQLRDLKKVHWLLLEGTRVGDTGLTALAGWTSLDTLMLDGTPVGDAGLACLKHTPIRNLHLVGTQVEDAGLSHLKEMSVECLYLDKTRVGDAGLAHLHEAHNLSLVSLSETRVTASGVRELQASRPKCLIIAFTP